MGAFDALLTFALPRQDVLASLLLEVLNIVVLWSISGELKNNKRT